MRIAVLAALTLAVAAANGVWADTTTSPTSQPLSIVPPDIKDQVDKKLPDEVADLAVGAGGRYLIMHFKTAKKLGIFDINTLQIVKYLPLASDDITFAAGADRLVVVDREKNVMERYNLATFERELANTAPVLNIRTILMGCMSTTNALVISGEKEGPATLSLLDVKKFKATAIKAPDRLAAAATLMACVSPDGSLYSLWHPDMPPMSLVVMGEQSMVYTAWSGSIIYMSPGPDNRTIYTQGGMFNYDMKAVGKMDRPNSRYDGTGTYYLPAVQGQYFIDVTLKWTSTDNKGRDQITPRVSMHVDRDINPLITLTGTIGLDTDCVRPYSRNGQPQLPVYKRIIYIPAAQVLAMLLPSNNEMTFIKVDVIGALKKSELDYLFVDSVPVTTGVKGQAYAYQVVAQSRKGSVKYALKSGPEGMKIAADGKITWAVPGDYAKKSAAVTVMVTDASGQEVLHTFQIDFELEPPAPSSAT